MDHLEILDMIARGLFGCPESLPHDLDNWPQVRPAMRAAHAELESARAEIARLKAALQRVMDGDCHRKTAAEFGGWTLDDDVRQDCVEALTGAAGRSE